MKVPSRNTPLEPFQVIRGEQARTPLNMGIIGGGKACYDLLRIIHQRNPLSRVKMKILGVADSNPQAPGLLYAAEKGIFTSTDFRSLFALEGLNLIIELTGITDVTDSVFRAKPKHISMIDHRGARFLWDLLQEEMDKNRLESERQNYENLEETQTQLILDSLPYRIMVVNMDMTVDKVNQTFRNEFNLSDDDVLKKHCYEVRYGLHMECSKFGRTCYMAEVKEKGSFISTIHEYETEDGDERYDVITVSPIFNASGEMVRILEASRDITDRIKLEREAQKTKTFLENVIQSTVDGIVVVDTKGNVLIFNEGMERLTGYSVQEIMETGHLTSFYNIDVARENMKKMRSDQHGILGKLNPSSMSITAKNGEEVPVTLSASIISVNGEEVGSVGVFTDMREILKMRKELEDAHLQLVQSEKIASVGRMAAGVAHEINNPLSGILIYAELLKESLKNNIQLENDIQEVIDQTLRCKKIVSDLLEFSRQSVGKTSSFSFEHLINKCLDLLINQATFQNIDVKKNIEPEMPEMVGDMGQLQQVFTNLFVNAADVMEGKGSLGIKAYFDQARSQFTIKISDTGPGIPKDYRDKIFDIFFTTKPVGKGTGLGLSISQNIIKLHGGNIAFECPEEGGTTFIIEIPLEFVESSTDEPVFIGLDE